MFARIVTNVDLLSASYNLSCQAIVYFLLQKYDIVCQLFKIGENEIRNDYQKHYCLDLLGFIVCFISKAAHLLLNYYSSCMFPEWSGTGIYIIVKIAHN